MAGSKENANEMDSVELLLTGSILKKRVEIEISGAFKKEGSINEIELKGKATYDKSLSHFLADLADCFDRSAGAQLTEMLGKQAQSLILESLTFSYQQADPKLAQIIVAMRIGSSRYEFTAIKTFAEAKNPEGGGFAIGLNLISNEAPIMGNMLEGLIGQVAFKDLGVHYASQELKNVSYYPFEGAGANEISLLGLIKRDFAKGFKVKADILIGGVNPFEALAGSQTPALDPESDKTPPAENQQPPAPLGTPEATDNDPIKWLEANKNIGPLSLRRVGLGYQAPRVAIKLDAGLQLSCLTFTLEGLGLSYPIDKLSTDPKKIWEHLRFNLDGASLCFIQGPLTISGGLIKASDDPLQLDGALLVKTPLFALSAIASYANLNGTPSFFMFAALIKELGGPSFFFITGLAFGFGVNRTLKLPSLNDVQNFPLIRAATDENYLGTQLDLRAISQKLGQYIAPSAGNYWMAAGIKFSSFGQIDSFVLLSVSFGTRLEFGLLGLSKLQVPKLLPGSSANNLLPVIVYAEMAIRAVVAPDTGLLCFEARLTENSYLLRKDFKLRGGFAFYTWFAGEHDGDFAISIGGYHSKFRAPAHYPKPDLVEFCCKIGDTIIIQGDCYFALCPSAIMTGGRLSIIFQTECIRAWFIAYAHFLIQWKPIYYDVSIGVSIGVALRFVVGVIRVNLTIELSASVNLYGPPLGGEARISLYIVTFTIKFGEIRRPPPPLLWESADIDNSFAKAFLPNPHVTTITVTDGLLKEIKTGETSHYLVSSQKLVLSALTLVPATAVLFNGAHPEDGEKKPLVIPQPEINGQPANLGIRPMDKNSFYSRISVSLVPIGDNSEKALLFLDEYIEVTLTTKSVPLALWGANPLDTYTPPKEQMIDKVLVGLEIRTKPGPRPGETPVMKLSVLAYDRQPVYEIDWAKITSRAALAGFGDKTIADTIAISEVVKRRNGIVELLARTGRQIIQPDEINLDQLSKSAEFLFQDMPAMAHVGQYPPRNYLDT